VNKARLEAFSDGIFSIAITLLVLTIAQPANYHDLLHELADRWPSLAAYVVSFVVIGIMWLNHHSLFGHFATVDRGLIYLNLVLLMTVCSCPIRQACSARPCGKEPALESRPSPTASPWR
jgi:uncharacterized membrane protein